VACESGSILSKGRGEIELEKMSVTDQTSLLRLMET
jgi:hypothetical protein